MGERFLDAAAEWGDRRLMESEEALYVKAEQALLEIEHLTSGATEVDFSVEGRTVSHEPSDALSALLSEQAAETGLEPAQLLRLHVDLFARVFLDEEDSRPPGTPPT